MTGAGWWKPLLLVLVATSPAGVRPASGWQLPGGPTQKLRVAVMDLSGSALKMQSTTTMMPGSQPGMQQPYGQPATRQTTVTVDVPPPAEFARGLTEALATVLVRTGRFTVLERAAIQSVQQEQQIGASGAVPKGTHKFTVTVGWSPPTGTGYMAGPGPVLATLSADTTIVIP